MTSQLEREVTRDINQCLGGNATVVRRIEESLGGYTAELTISGLTDEENTALRNSGYRYTTKATEEGTLTLVLKPTDEKRAELRGED